MEEKKLNLEPPKSEEKQPEVQQIVEPISDNVEEQKASEAPLPVSPKYETPQKLVQSKSFDNRLPTSMICKIILYLNYGDLWRFSRGISKVDRQMLQKKNDF